MTGSNVRQMEAIIQQLEAQLNTAKEHIRQQDEYISGASSATQEIVNACRSFCYQMLEPLIASRTCTMSDLKGKTLPELLKTARKHYEEERQQQKQIYIQFAEKLKEKSEIVSGLQAQVSQLQIQLAQAVQGGEQSLPDVQHEDPEFQRQTAYLIDNGKDDVASIQPPVQKQETVEKALDADAFARSVVLEKPTAIPPVKGEPKAAERSPMMVDYEKYKAQMTPLMWSIIQVIGGEGLCEFPEIKSRCLELSKPEDNVNITTLNNALTALRNIGAITKKTKVNTGVRWFYVYELTELGYRIYVDRFKKQPVESEITKLVREHDNLRHGYYIKDAAGILRNNYDYTTVSTSRKANYIRLPNSKGSIPDIICADGTHTDYFEVECGNHQQADFNDKCNKLAQITQNLYFIVPDAETMNRKLSPQIEAWIRSTKGNLSKAHIVVYLTTMKKLADKKWSLVYDLSSKTPDVPTNLSTEADAESVSESAETSEKESKSKLK